MAYDIDLMVKVFYLYYKCRLKQESITRQLNVSKYMVSGVLKSALRNGNIQIKVLDPTVNTLKLEKSFKNNFNSKDCLL